MGNKLHKLAALAAAAISITVSGQGATASAATDSADQLQTTGQIQCWDIHRSNSYGQIVDVICQYGGHERGVVRLYGGYGSRGNERFVVDDTYQDQRRVTGYLTWPDSTIRKKITTGTFAWSNVSIAEGTRAFVWVCVDGLGCGDGHSVVV